MNSPRRRSPSATASPDAPVSGLTRRTFLQNSLAAAGGLALPSIIYSVARGASAAVPPSERITIGLVGKGVMGNGHLKYLAHRDDVELVAVCDVDRTRREAGRSEIADINADKAWHAQMPAPPQQPMRSK